MSFNVFSHIKQKKFGLFAAKPLPKFYTNLLTFLFEENAQLDLTI